MAKRKTAPRNRQFNAYRNRYQGLVESVAATQISSTVAADVLRGFPRHLPPKHRNRITLFLKDVVMTMDAAMKLPRAGGSGSIDIGGHRTGRLQISVIQMLIARGVTGRRVFPTHFNYRVRAQELVMLFSHLDAFLCDSLRTIYAQRPDALKRSELAHSSEEVLACGSWDGLISFLIERRIYVFGMKSTRDQFSFLEKELGLSIDVDSSPLSHLDGAEPVRHAIVHSNCRVTHEFKRRLPRSTLKVGQLVPIPQQLVDGTASAVIAVCSEMFSSIADKFFGVPEASISGVWRKEAPSKKA